MNKRLIPLLILSPILLSSCAGWNFDVKNSDFTPSQSSSETTTGSSSSIDEHPEVSFQINKAEFLDKEGHIKVTFTCNYASPFEVYGHEFAGLNISGNSASELDGTHPGYFTCLSPFIKTSLKFEFINDQGHAYISVKYDNVIQYDEGSSSEIIYPEGYSTLFWSDEFDGTSLNTSNWSYQTGNGDWGWGNGELQYYTNTNDKVSDGLLTITAKKEKRDSFEYTSTRIRTYNKVKFTYAYVEARISLPAGTAMWPAFWMMPNDDTYGGWPHSGEIDIMEARGRLTNQSSSAIHYSLLDGNHTYKTGVKYDHNITQFHKYATEWTENAIKFYVDDVCYLNYDKSVWSTSGAPSSETAPFDKDFYIILNLAIGGQFDNFKEPDSNFVSAEMKVDYVRVFKK
jgi:hypothetical protein